MILIVTVLVSLAAFNNETLMNKLILWPRRMDKPAEYYRLLTSGFIHADYQHLFFNMFTLYFFGRNLEMVFAYLSVPPIHLITLFVTGIVIACLPSFFKHRNNSYYRSLGASGGVAAVIFASIYYNPWGLINFIIPSIVFAILYLVFSAYMSRKGNNGINHDAHFWGSVYGLLFALMVDPTHGRLFIDQITHPTFNF